MEEQNKTKRGNPFIQFIKYSRKHGFKQALKQTNENLITLYTPESALKTQIIGYTGMMIGIMVAVIMFFLKGVWYLSIISIFSFLIMQSQLRMCIKQRRILMQINKEIKEVEKEEELKESEQNNL